MYTSNIDITLNESVNTAYIVFNEVIDTEIDVDSDIKEIVNNDYDGNIEKALTEAIKHIDYGILSEALETAILKSLYRF